MRLIAAALFLLMPVTAAAQASVLLRSEISPKEILIGDPLNMTITVVYSAAITPAPVEFQKTMGDFELVASESTAPKPAKNDRMTSIHRLTLTTFSTGTVTLPAISLYFKNADGSLSEARTDDVAITVKSLLAEKGDEGSLRPLKGLYNSRPLWPLWALAGLAAAGLIAWLLVRAHRRRAAAGVDGPTEPIHSPEEEAERAIVALEQGTYLEEGRYKEFYSALSAILRRYAERRYALTATEMTSSELLAAFRKAGVPTEPSYIARAFLDNADLVKFAKLTPEPHELTADIARLRGFITETTPRPPEPEPVPEEMAPL